MRKKLIAILFIVIFFSCSSMDYCCREKPEVLPIGSKLPIITFKAINGYDTLKIDYKNKILVIFFSKDCPLCKYELNVLNKNLNKIERTEIYLLTTDTSYFNSKDIEENEMLLSSHKVKYGIVNKENYYERFGSLLTPSLYFLVKKEYLHQNKR